MLEKQIANLFHSPGISKEIVILDENGSDAELLHQIDQVSNGSPRRLMAESPFIELEVVTEFAIIGTAATGDDLQLAFRRCGSRREIVLHVDEIVVGPWNAIQVLDHGTRRGEVGAPVTLVANPLDVGKIAPGPQAIGQLNEACLPFPRTQQCRRVRP